MNVFLVDGFVGKVERKENAVFLRVCHKETFFDKKKGEWDKDESWMTIAFYGKKGDAVERIIEKNDHVIVKGTMNTWPKEGIESRVRFNASEFHLVNRQARYRNTEGQVDQFPYDEGDDYEQEG